jgi:hypothetical protein
MVNVVKVHASIREQKKLKELFERKEIPLAEFSTNSQFIKRLLNSKLITIEESEGGSSSNNEPTQ